MRHTALRAVQWPLMSYIVVSTPHRELTRQVLDGPLVVGRGPECGLCITDRALSRQHCRLEQDGDFWFVHDMNSRNGTLVDGRRIERCPLDDGAVITAGHLRIGFHTGPLMPARPAQPQPLVAAATPANHILLGPTPKPRPLGSEDTIDQSEETLLSPALVESEEAKPLPLVLTAKHARPHPLVYGATPRRHMRPWLIVVLAALAALLMFLAVWA